MSDCNGLDLVCYSEDGPDEAKSRFRRIRGTPSACDTFIPREWELENLRKHVHVEGEFLTRLEPRILKILQRNRVDLPLELDHFLDRCEANLYLNFTVEEVVDQNWSGEEEEKDGMEKSEINRKRDGDENAVKGDDDQPIHVIEKDHRGEEERALKRCKRSGSEIHVDNGSRMLLNSWINIDPYLQEPARSSCSTHQRGVSSGLPFRPLPPPAINQPSGVQYQMKEILPKKAARTTSNVIANESRSESTGSKPAQTCPCATRQYEPQQSYSVHQPQYLKGSPILYEPEFVATIKRNKRKVEFDSINVVMEEQHERRELMDAVLAHIDKVVPKEQPQDSISTH